MAPVSQLESVALALIRQNIGVKIAVTVLILVGGILAARIAGKIVRYVADRAARRGSTVERVRRRGRSPDRLVEYAVVVLTLVTATIYINASAVGQLSRLIVGYAPRVVTAVLLFILGIILVKGLVALIRGFVENLNVKKQAETVGVSPKVLDGFLAAIKLFLYFVVLEIAVIQLGVSTRIINTTITAASYGIVLLLVLLGFFGFKDLIQNYAAGIYLRGSEVLKPGKRIKLDDETGEIRETSTFSTTVNTDSGYFLLAPNKNLMDREILFKRVKADVDTLEEITDYFVSEQSEYRGAAVGEMALTMFGFDATQGDISEELEDSQPSPEALGSVLEEMAGGEVRHGFVDGDKITDLGREARVWLDNDALLLPYLHKEVLFPGSEAERYVLVVAVEGDELLVLDPETGGSGGVYYVDAGEMQEAIADTDGGGYLVLAPRGTTGFWRIKNDLIYANLSLYKQLSKNLEVQLSKILRRGDAVKQVVPDVVDDFMTRWRAEETGDAVTTMWRPNGNGEAHDDEATDDN
ncbi:MAG: mechanosensitive ion channel [Candidatus Nanohaloarchaea archaeon]|nr:mechanosensitive ion channel [Candidatus Nanohaloarchaea archaeon]